MTSEKIRYDGIQILRVVLFVGIVAFHCNLPGTQIFWGGVEVFFVISSYFLTKKLSQVTSTELHMLNMMKHRIGRLIPVYYLVCIGVFGLVLIVRRVFAIKDILFHVFFSQNINWMITGYQSDMVVFTGHTWTLSIEVYLFFVWLIAFKIIRDVRSRRIFNYFSICVAILYRIITVVCIGDVMITSLCPLAHMDAFAIGSLLAMKDEDRHEKKVYSYCIAGCGVLLVFTSIIMTARLNDIDFIQSYCLYKTSKGYLDHPFTCNVYLGFSMLSVGLIRFAKGTIKRNLFTKIMILCGNMTYIAYLLHYPITVVLKRINCNEWISFAITMVVSLIGANILEKILKMMRN